MTSKVELANIALAHIRAQAINDFDEASINAQYVKLFYPMVRDSLLRGTNWNFARKQRAMSVYDDVELFDYAYAYQYPNDCLRINTLKSVVTKVGSTSEGFAFRPDYYDDNPYIEQSARRLRVPYSVENVDGNRIIGANEPDLWIDYRSRVDDPNKYDALFIEALTWYLAAELAIPIIGGDVGRSERQNAWQIYSQMVGQAQAEMLNEMDGGMEGGIDSSELIMVRS